MKVLIINGPNLNLLGTREPDLYGAESFDDFFKELRERYGRLNHEIDHFQSNHCGAIIDKIQEADGQYDGLVINPGGYSHSSVALADAVKTFRPPVVEVHVTNIHARESFRHSSLISANVQGVVCGLGISGYDLALQALLNA